MRDADSGNNMRKILMDNKDISFDIYQPFGPSILKTKLPQAYVDALNQQSDKILNDVKTTYFKSVPQGHVPDDKKNS